MDTRQQHDKNCTKICNPKVSCKICSESRSQLNTEQLLSYLFFKGVSVVYNIAPGGHDSVAIFLLRNASSLSACINRYGLQSEKKKTNLFCLHSTLVKPKCEVLVNGIQKIVIKVLGGYQ